MGSTHSNLLFHLIFRTRKSSALIDPTIQKVLYPYIDGIVKGEKADLLAIGGIEDHIHLLIRLRPTHHIPDIVRRIKGNSSKWINEKWADRERFAWQRGYGIFSVSESNSMSIKKYIDRQEAHHKRMSFRHEYLIPLEKHPIEFDENFL